MPICMGSSVPCRTRTGRELSGENPQTSFNVISPRKPEKRSVTDLRVGLMREEKVLPNLDISNDGLGVLLATGYYNLTCSADNTRAVPVHTSGQCDLRVLI